MYVSIYYINTLLAGKIIGFWVIYLYIIFWILGYLIKLVFSFFFFLFPVYLKFWTQFDFVSFSSHIHYDCWFMIVVSVAFILFWSFRFHGRTTPVLCYLLMFTMFKYYRFKSQWSTKLWSRYQWMWDAVNIANNHDLINIAWKGYFLQLWFLCF